MTTVPSCFALHDDIEIGTLWRGDGHGLVERYRGQDDALLPMRNPAIRRHPGRPREFGSKLTRGPMQQEEPSQWPVFAANMGNVRNRQVELELLLIGRDGVGRADALGRLVARTGFGPSGAGEENKKFRSFGVCRSCAADGTRMFGNDCRKLRKSL